jgi:hypothetical protein
VVSEILTKEKKYFRVGKAILGCLEPVADICFSDKIN